MLSINKARADHVIDFAAEELKKYLRMMMPYGGDISISYSPEAKTDLRVGLMDQHPTQTLTDLLTIRSLKHTLSNFTIGLCGDLKFGRTVHSLINAMVRYENIKFYLISPPELTIPSYLKEEVLNAKNIQYMEVTKLEDVMPYLDILYMTRVQKERFFNEEDYIRLKDSFILDTKKLKNAKKDMLIMHPLPRVNEIAVEVDDDERAVYFKQAHYGVYMRMALIMKLLGLSVD